MPFRAQFENPLISISTMILLGFLIVKEVGEC
jgi:hypothetical protein